MSDWLTDIFAAMLSGGKATSDTLQNLLGVLGGPTKVSPTGSSGGTQDWTSVFAALLSGEGGQSQTSLLELLRQLSGGKQGSEVDVSRLMSLFGGSAAGTGEAPSLANVAPKNVAPSLLTPEELQASQNIADLLKKEAADAIGGLDPEVYSIGRAMYGPGFDRALQVLQEGPELSPWRKVLALAAAGLTGDPNTALIPVAMKRQEYQRSWEIVQEAQKAKRELDRGKREQARAALDLWWKLMEERRRAAEEERKGRESQLDIERKRIELERLRQFDPQLKEVIKDIYGRENKLAPALVQDFIEERVDQKGQKGIARVVRVDEDALNALTEQEAQRAAQLYGVPIEKARGVIAGELRRIAETEVRQRLDKPPPYVRSELRAAGVGGKDQLVWFILDTRTNSVYPIPSGAQLPSRGSGRDEETQSEYVARTVGTTPFEIVQKAIRGEVNEVEHPLDPEQKCQVMRIGNGVIYFQCKGLGMLSVDEYLRRMQQYKTIEAKAKYQQQRGQKPGEQQGAARGKPSGGGR